MISERDMMHGRHWSGQDVQGWYATEKLDGCRGYWDGERMWSRSGRQVPIPDEWRRRLPAMHLDGELWAGRDGFQRTLAAVTHGRFDGVYFMVFDAPQVSAAWPQRLAAAGKRLKVAFAAPVPWRQVAGRDDAAQFFRIVRERGGEGLMLVHPEGEYQAIRTGRVLKLKRCPITGRMAWSPEERKAARDFSRAAA